MFLIWWYFYNTYFPVEMFLSHLPLCIGLDLAVLAVQPPSASGRGWQRGQPVLRGSHLSDSVLFEHLLVFLFLFLFLFLYLYLQHGLHLFLLIPPLLIPLPPLPPPPCPPPRSPRSPPRLTLSLTLSIVLEDRWTHLLLFIVLIHLIGVSTIKQTSVCTPDVCVEPIGWTVRIIWQSVLWYCKEVTSW